MFDPPLEQTAWNDLNADARGALDLAHLGVDVDLGACTSFHGSSSSYCRRAFVSLMSLDFALGARVFTDLDTPIVGGGADILLDDEWKDGGAMNAEDAALALAQLVGPTPRATGMTVIDEGEYAPAEQDDGEHERANLVPSLSHTPCPRAPCAFSHSHTMPTRRSLTPSEAELQQVVPPRQGF